MPPTVSHRVGGSLDDVGRVDDCAGPQPAFLLPSCRQAVPEIGRSPIGMTISATGCCGPDCTWEGDNLARANDAGSVVVQRVPARAR
jgi:hypothetical protein